MALRFISGNNTPVSSHNELTDKGTYTHAELDAICAEVAESRGEFGTLKSRLDWLTLNGGGKVSFNAYMHEVFVAEVEVSTVTLGGTYQVGSNELEVYRNGLRMAVEDDYVEDTERTVIFNEPLTAGEVVVFRVKDRFGIIEPLGEHHEYFITTSEDDLVFNLTHGFNTDGNNLSVAVNGIRQAIGHDYEVTGDKVITFLAPPPVGSLVYFKVTDRFINSPPTVLTSKFVTTTDTDYTLDFTYNPGNSEIAVYVGGVEYYAGRDFEEIDFDKIRLLNPVGAGAPVLVCKENSGAFNGRHAHYFNVVPTGVVDGENDTFAVEHIPQVGTVCIYYDGRRLASNNYTVNRNQIIFSSPPGLGIELLVDYMI